MNSRFCKCGKIVKPKSISTDTYSTDSKTYGNSIWKTRCSCGVYHTWKIAYYADKY